MPTHEAPPSEIPADHQPTVRGEDEPQPVAYGYPPLTGWEGVPPFIPDTVDEIDALDKGLQGDVSDHG